MQRHRFDPVSAFFGALFVLMALHRLVGDELGIRLPWGVLSAVAVIGFGVVLLVGALRRERSGG